MSDDVAVAVPIQHYYGLLRPRLERPDGCAGLVVGCGDGNEVVYLRRAFASRQIVGLDLKANFSALARAEESVFVADATNLPLPSARFDFAVTVHALEHIPNPQRALSEMRRVLRPGGWLYVGVPNRSRLVGYVGSFDASLREKIVWNFIDYGARLRGRFHNRFGAHAGFSARELIDLLGTYFSGIELLTDDYLRVKYGKRIPAAVLNVILSRPLINYAAPSHYVLCRKER